MLSVLAVCACLASHASESVRVQLPVRAAGSLSGAPLTLDGAFENLKQELLRWWRHSTVGAVRDIDEVAFFKASMLPEQRCAVEVLLAKDVKVVCIKKMSKKEYAALTLNVSNVDGMQEHMQRALDVLLSRLAGTTLVLASIPLEYRPDEKLLDDLLQFLQAKKKTENSLLSEGPQVSDIAAVSEKGEVSFLSLSNYASGNDMSLAMPLGDEPSKDTEDYPDAHTEILPAAECGSSRRTTPPTDSSRWQLVPNAREFARRHASLSYQQKLQLWYQHVHDTLLQIDPKTNLEVFNRVALMQVRRPEFD
ncbi:MAG: hypothetical protein MHM6MM_005432 [Cercozoa sp. M6MM]